jgi:hypothetical protein
MLQSSYCYETNKKKYTVAVIVVVNEEVINNFLIELKSIFDWRTDH